MSVPQFDVKASQPGYLARSDFGTLIATLVNEGYTVIGPKLVDGVVMLRPIKSVDDLARGKRDRQEAGSYRVTAGDPERFFDYVVGPDSPKRYLFPPKQRLYTIHVDGDDFVFDEGPPSPPKYAFLGIRPCELAAMVAQDRVFIQNERGGEALHCEMDSYYKQAREKALVIAVNCTHPGGTCFCESMGTGPQAYGGFDLALTEQRAGFLVDVGSSRGGELAGKLPIQEASLAEVELAELQMEKARQKMGRTLNPADMPELLTRNIENSRWDEVAQRCLGCANCTMVCPTCFCSSITDSHELVGDRVSRTRVWDSCYTHQYSYTTSGPVRSSNRARYRHWLRHKLGTWHDQFGTSGCVGCGRCITWCPSGIDITEEAAAIRQTDLGPARSAVAKGGF